MKLMNEMLDPALKIIGILIVDPIIKEIRNQRVNDPDPDILIIYGKELRARGSCWGY